MKQSLRTQPCRLALPKPLAIFLCVLAASLSTAVLPAETNSPSSLQSQVNFMEGIMSGDIEVMERNFTAIDPNQKFKRFTIYAAIEFDQIDALRWLIKNGTDIETPSVAPDNIHSFRFLSDGYISPLMLAIILQRKESIQFLLDSGASIQANGNYSKSPAHAALAVGDTELLRQFEQLGINWKLPLSDGIHPLSFAILNNNFEAIQFLLDGRADPNAPMGNENYPLADAAVEGNPEMLRVLLEYGADPNAISKSTPMIRHAKRIPHTALINAIRRNSQPCVEILLKAGADPQILATAAIKWADLLGHQGIYELLLKNGATKPAPYAFLDLPQFRGIDPVPVSDKNSSIPWTLLTAINNPLEESLPPNDEPVSIAVISLSEGTAVTADLLVAGLSDLSGVNLVERDELRLLSSEKTLSQNAFFDPSTAARSGQLEGADAAIFLTRSADTIQLRAVAASSGLIILNTTLPERAFNPETTRKLARSIAHATHRLPSDLSDQLLVSLPKLTPSRSTPEGDLLARQLSTALAMVLGAQPSLYVLDRSELQRLSLEEDLNTDIADFYKSGLIIDGGLEFPPDQATHVVLNLRARTLDGVEKASISTPGFIANPHKLLAEAASSLLDQLEKSDSAPTSRSSEAAVYFQQARTAYESQVWSEAYALTQAAEALGQSGDDFRKLRIRSILRLLGSDQLLIRKGLRETEDSETDILVRCMPLEFLPDQFVHRSPRDYFDIANELLDLSVPIIYSDKEISPTESAFWEYLPEIFELANMPLELMLSISDQQAYAAEFAELRRRLLQQSEDAIRNAKDRQLSELYCKLVILRTQLLRYWIPDESEVIAQTLQTVADAHRLEPPYILHSLIDKITGVNHNMRIRLIGNRVDTFPARLAAALATCDYPHARLKGAVLMQRWGRGFKNRLRWTKTVADLFEDLYVNDPSPIGASLTVYDGGEPQSIFPWYSRPDFMHDYQRIYFRVYDESGHASTEEFITPPAQKWMAELESKRLEFMAKNGKGPFSNLSNYHRFHSDRDPVLLAKQLEDAETVFKYFSPQDPDRGERWVADQFESSVLKPRRDALASLAPVALLRKLPTTTVTGILPEYIDTFRESLASKNPDSLRVDRVLETDRDAIWFSVEDGGFFEISSRGEVSRSLKFPNGIRNARPLAVNDKYLLAITYSSNFNYEISAYNFGSKSWKLLTKNYAERVKATLHGNHALLIISRNPTHGYSHTADSEEGATFTLELINIPTKEHKVLVSSRRMPPQSPLDNDVSTIRNSISPESLSDQEIHFQGMVYNLETLSWRKRSKKDHEMLKSLYKPVDLNPDPWGGWIGHPTYDPDTGQWKFRVSIIIYKTPGSSAFGGVTGYNISVPVHPISLPDEISGLTATEIATLTAPESFYYRSTPLGVLAISDRMVALIPKEAIIPHIFQQLDAMNIPEYKKPTP